jgi:hypothetical protein
MSQRMNYNAASPAGMKALGAIYGDVRQSGLPSRLVDLVFLRVSQMYPEILEIFQSLPGA